MPGYQLAGVEMGASLHSRHFYREAVYCADMILSTMEGMSWNQPLPGIGIPSDFALLLDPVALGTSPVPKNDEVVMLALFLVSSQTCGLYTPMLGAPTLPPGGHAGAGLCAVALQALQQHAGQYDMAVLRARLALVGGDGAVRAGGEDARHSSSGAAELIFSTVHPDKPAMTDWDGFHRDDLAVARAIKRTAAAKRLYDVSAALHSALGVSEGRSILRSVGAALEEPVLEQQKFAGTRKVGHMGAVPQNIMRNYKAITASLHARMQWRRAGHGSWTLENLTALSRNINDPSFIMFLLMFRDVTTGPLQKHAHLVQQAAEPWLVHVEDAELVQNLTSLQRSIEKLESLLLVTVLCLQHLAPQAGPDLLETLGSI